jgi:hypothetical protein
VDLVVSDDLVDFDDLEKVDFRLILDEVDSEILVILLSNLCDECDDDSRKDQESEMM